MIVIAGENRYEIQVVNYELRVINNERAVHNIAFR